jgi:hypothetical protein
MRLVSWQRLGIVASVVWVAVGPTYFHLSQEENATRIAGDRYQLCIKQAWAAKGGVERCNNASGRLLPLPSGAVGLSLHLFRWRWRGLRVGAWVSC